MKLILNESAIEKLPLLMRANLNLLPDNLSIHDIAVLILTKQSMEYPEIQNDKDQIAKPLLDGVIETLIDACKNNTLKYDGDINGREYEEDVDNFLEPDHFLPHIPYVILNPGSEHQRLVVTIIEKPSDCTIHKTEFKRYLEDNFGWPPQNTTLINWWNNTERVTTKNILDDKTLTKSEKQTKAMLTVAKKLNYNPDSIPDGGKTKMKEQCQQDYPDLFDGDTSFDNAWKKKNSPFQMKNHASYSKNGM